MKSEKDNTMQGNSSQLDNLGSDNSKRQDHHVKGDESVYYTTFQRNGTMMGSHPTHMGDDILLTNKKLLAMFHMQISIT